MSQTNTKQRRKVERTHEGAAIPSISPEQQLTRSVLACLLFEDGFYENGISISDRIAQLVRQVPAEFAARIAIKARVEMNLRHAPLWVAANMATATPHYLQLRELLPKIILRPDEMGEFISMLWKVHGKKKSSLGHGVKKGLAAAMAKFNEYQLGKYNNKEKAVKLRDVLFLSHVKHSSDEQKALFERVAQDTLAIPDTWEVALSAGYDKKQTWERLLAEKKLGGLALLRNLRNMVEVGVNQSLIEASILKMNTDRILPFRFITAARHAPLFEPYLEDAMMQSLLNHPVFNGTTVVLVDVSGSMENNLSARSEVSGMDTACGLVILLREICDKIEIYTFSDKCVKVPNRKGFDLADAIKDSQSHQGTYTGKALTQVNRDVTYDRVIVLTDGQSHDPIPDPKAKGYFINIAATKNGVGYGRHWLTVDGWSEQVVRYIHSLEREAVNVCQ